MIFPLSINSEAIEIGVGGVNITPTNGKTFSCRSHFHPITSLTRSCRCHISDCFRDSKARPAHSVQPLSFRLNSNVENFYHNGALPEGRPENARVPARIKGKRFLFHGFLREQKRGRKKVASATELLQVPYILLTFLLEKTCVVECLDLW